MKAKNKYILPKSKPRYTNQNMMRLIGKMITIKKIIMLKYIREISLTEN